MGRLLSYLPPFLQEYRELKEILNAEEPEIDKLIQEIQQIKDNQFILSCNEQGITKFEKILKIVPNPDDNLEGRISRVIARWNDGIPYTYKGLIEKLDILCGVGNYTLNANFDEYKLEIITHLELSSQIEELGYFLSYIIPANMILESKNELFINLNATVKLAVGIASCETFELSDSFKKNMQVEGTSMFASSLVEGMVTTLSDAFKKDMSFDGMTSFGGGIVGAIVVEISDSFNESIDVSGHTVMTAGVSITESN